MCWRKYWRRNDALSQRVLYCDCKAWYTRCFWDTFPRQIRGPPPCWFDFPMLSSWMIPLSSGSLSPYHKTLLVLFCISHNVPHHSVSGQISGLKLPFFFGKVGRLGEVLRGYAWLVDVKALVLRLVAVFRVHVGIKIYLLINYLKLILWSLKDAAMQSRRRSVKLKSVRITFKFAFSSYITSDINPFNKLVSLSIYPWLKDISLFSYY